MLQDILSNFDFLTWPGSDSGSGWHGNITWQFWAPTSCGLYIIFSRTSAKAERDLTNLSCVFLYVDLFWPPPAENVISTRNFLISSPDLVSAPKFTLEWYSFSNRSLKIALLQIYFNITKLFEEIWKKWPPSSPRPLSQSECTWQQKCCHLLEKKATHQMRMQDF